jgi:DNA-binding PadR family transcriptional regulator
MSRERIENEETGSSGARVVEGGARKQQTYQLFVLGNLMNQPLHGYLLRDTLSNVLGPFRQISWGALYPLIRQLEHDGLIALDMEGDGGRCNREASGRQRKRYRITDAGRERFLAMMLEPDEYTVDTPELFLIKLIHFKYVSSEQQLAILQHYLGYLRMVENYTQMQQRRKESHQESYKDRDLTHILRGISLRLHGVQAQLQWVEQEIARVAAEAERAP